MDFSSWYFCLFDLGLKEAKQKNKLPLRELQYVLKVSSTD